MRRSLGKPDVSRVEEEAHVVGSELRVEKVDGVHDVFAELIGQVVRAPYPKMRHSSPILENPTLAFFPTLGYQLNQHFPIRVSVSK